MEADGRLLCISQAQKRMNGQVGLEEGLGAHNFIPRDSSSPVFNALVRCLFPWSTVQLENPDYKRRGDSTTPHSTPQGRRTAQPCSLVTDRWRSGSQGGKSLEYRNDTPRFSDIYTILKWLMHMHHLQSSVGVMICFSIERQLLI
jgi:hypothetical protein